MKKTLTALLVGLTITGHSQTISTLAQLTAKVKADSMAQAKRATAAENRVTILEGTDKVQKAVIDSLRKVINDMPVLSPAQYTITGSTAVLKLPADVEGKRRIDSLSAAIQNTFAGGVLTAKSVDSLVKADKIVHNADDSRHNALLSSLDTANERINRTEFNAEEFAQALADNGIADERLKTIVTAILSTLKQFGLNISNIKQ